MQFLPSLHLLHSSLAIVDVLRPFVPAEVITHLQHPRCLVPQGTIASTDDVGEHKAGAVGAPSLLIPPHRLLPSLLRSGRLRLP